MRKVRLSLFLAVISILLFTISGNLFAQTKVGYIDSKKVLETMQETQDARTRLNTLVGEWQTEIRTLQDSLKNMKDDFEKKKLILTDQLKEQLQQEIKGLQDYIDAYKNEKFGEDGEYFAKQAEFMKPVQDKVFSAIQQVAREEDFDYIMDRSSDVVLLYVNERYDITSKVIKLIQGQ